jgi:hypothetical protein
MAIEISEWVTTETLVAIPKEEAVKLLQDEQRHSILFFFVLNFKLFE